jgi:hypothetical protein
MMYLPGIVFLFLASAVNFGVAEIRRRTQAS